MIKVMFLAFCALVLLVYDAGADTALEINQIMYTDIIENSVYDNKKIFLLLYNEDSVKNEIK